MDLRAAIMNPSSPLWLYFIIINVVCWLAMGIDKYRAVHHKWRIPEKTLFLFALLGGSAGGIIGMYGFHHKTLHKKFSVGFPVILICESALLFWLGRGTQT